MKRVQFNSSRSTDQALQRRPPQNQMNGFPSHSQGVPEHSQFSRHSNPPFDDQQYFQQVAGNYPQNFQSLGQGQKISKKSLNDSGNFYGENLHGSQQQAISAQRQRQQNRKQINSNQKSTMKDFAIPNAGPINIAQQSMHKQQKSMNSHLGMPSHPMNNQANFKLKGNVNPEDGYQNQQLAQKSKKDQGLPQQDHLRSKNLVQYDQTINSLQEVDSQETEFNNCKVSLPDEILEALTNELKAQLAEFQPTYQEAQQSDSMNQMIEDTTQSIQNQFAACQEETQQILNDQEDVLKQLKAIVEDQESSVKMVNNKLGAKVDQQSNKYEDWSDECKNLFVKLEVQRRYFNSVACELLSFTFGMKCPSSLEAFLERNEIIQTDVLNRVGRSFPIREFLDQRDAYMNLSDEKKAELRRQRETFVVRPSDYVPPEERKEKKVGNAKQGSNQGQNKGLFNMIGKN